MTFVFLPLSKRFDDISGELDYPLKVEIADDRPMRVSRVHWGCTLELFSKQCLIDLIHIPLRESKVVMGIDWLSLNGVMIDCGLHLVRV